MIGMGAGADLVARIVADMAAQGLEPDGKERELLAIAEKLADRQAELERIVDDEGMTYESSRSGVAHPHPAVTESRLTAESLSRVLARISMTENAKDPAKVKAAQARWLAHNMAKAQRGG